VINCAYADAPLALSARRRPDACERVTIERTEVRPTGGSRIPLQRGATAQPTCTATQPRRPASGDRRRRLAPCFQRLTTHSKNRVGMAGFEPAASCSQISSIRTLDVAPCRSVSGSPETMHAARGLTWLSVCARWLPLWLPPKRSSATPTLPTEQKVESCNASESTPILGAQAGDECVTTPALRP